MKKTALTIGLFSLVMVTTSFTTSELTSANFNKKQYSSMIDPKGSQTGGETRKADLYSSGDQSVLTGKNLDFTNVNQSLGLNKKQD